MLSELKKLIKQKNQKNVFECASEILTNKEAGDEYVKEPDEEIKDIADSLPLTDEVENPDIKEVIERYIIPSRL